MHAPRLRSRCLAQCTLILLGTLLPTITFAEVAEVEAPADAPPSDAVMIFDGTSAEHLVKTDGSPCDWKIEDGALVVPGTQRANRGVWSTYHFRDAQIHLEFLQPKVGKAHGNSGVYLHGICELQIYGAKENVEEDDLIMGAIYRINPPLVNAGRPLGEWQTYDLLFTAPRRDEEGKVVKPGKITALLNGVLVQHETEFDEPLSQYAPMTFRVSPYTKKVNEHIRKSEAGPLYLQDHDSKVRFRNVWVRPLDDKAGWFTP
jgi:hypothetical protein